MPVLSKPVVLLLLTCLALSNSYAQKRVLSYPFEFEKSFLAKGDYDTYFLDNTANNTFALVIKDNKKMEYVLVDEKFKVISRISLPRDNSVFDVKGLKDYTGGTVSGRRFQFVYPGSDDYYMETVDFDTKTVSHKKVLDVPKEEKQLVAFSDNNIFYAITSNNKTGAITVNTINAAGEPSQKTIAFPIPEEASRHRDKLSEYLKGLKVIKGSEFPDLSTSIKPAKLFTTPNDLVFVINDGDNPAHIVTFHLPDLTMQEKKIDYSSLVAKNEKGNVYVSSFLKNGKLFSLVLNKRNIRIVTNDAQTGALLNNIEINDDTGMDMFADGPIAEQRVGKRESAKDIGSVKKLIKAFTSGTEGLMIAENKSGQFVVTAGTYDLIKLSSGGSGGSWQGGWKTNPMPKAPGASGPGTSMPVVWDNFMYYRPGQPSYTITDARYYNTTYFKLILDPNTLKIAHGRAPQSVPDQIKDFIDTIDKNAKATNQFAIGKNQYYGYYDRDSGAYVVEQIRISQ